MAIVISGVNNNDKITAADGTIDLLSGVNYSSEVEVPSLKVGNNIQFGNAGIVTATSFAGNISGTTGTFGDFVDVGSNIQLGNAGVATATTFVGNLTGNVNNTGALLFQVGGSEKVRIDSAGRLLLNTTTTYVSNQMMIVKGASPSAGGNRPYDGQLAIEGSETTGAINTGGVLAFIGHSGSGSRGFGSIRCLKEDGTSGNYGSYMSFETRANGSAPAEKIRIDSSGKLLSGHTAALTKFHGPASTTKRNPHIQVNGTNVNGASMSLTSWDNNVNAYYGPAIYLAKSGSSTIGTNSRLDNSNSILGSIIFSGDDGDEFVKGAMIQGAVDDISGAQTGNNDMPGRLMFFTTADGAQEPTERLRITSDGKIGINNDNPVYALHMKNVMASSPSYIHMQATGSNVDGGGGGISFDTSAANTNETLYKATIAGIRNTQGNGSNDLVFSTSDQAINGAAPTEKLRISSKGYVTKPAHPSFCARYQSGDGFVSTNIFRMSLVNNDNFSWNTGSHYSTSTGKFTAPVAGVYFFEAQAMTTGHSNNDNIQDMMELRTNNGLVTYCRQRRTYFKSDVDANGYYVNGTSGQVNLAVGDTVWFQRRNGLGYSYGNSNYSYFTGWLIG